MKKIIFTLALAAAAVSCTKFTPAPDPEVPAGGQVTVTASVSDVFGTPFKWSDTDAIGIYNMEKTLSNVMYVPMNAFIGKTGEATLYGSEVSGSLVAYYPYSDKGSTAVGEGRIPLSPSIRYCESALSQIMDNILLLANGNGGKFVFECPTGALHMKLAFEIEGDNVIKSATLHSPAAFVSGKLAIDEKAEEPITEGGNDLTLYGISRKISPSEALDIWFPVPAGEYKFLELHLLTQSGVNVVKPVPGTFVVVKGRITEAAVGDDRNDYGGSDLEIIPGIFD